MNKDNLYLPFFFSIFYFIGWIAIHIGIWSTPRESLIYHYPAVLWRDFIVIIVLTIFYYIFCYILQLIFGIKDATARLQSTVGLFCCLVISFVVGIDWSRLI